MRRPRMLRAGRLYRSAGPGERLCAHNGYGSASLSGTATWGRDGYRRIDGTVIQVQMAVFARL